MSIKSLPLNTRKRKLVLLTYMVRSLRPLSGRHSIDIQNSIEGAGHILKELYIE